MHEVCTARMGRALVAARLCAADVHESVQVVAGHVPFLNDAAVAWWPGQGISSSVVFSAHLVVELALVLLGGDAT